MASQTSAPSNAPMVSSNKPPSFLIQTWWSLKSRDFLNLRIQSKYGKIPTKKTPYLDTFHVG